MIVKLSCTITIRNLFLSCGNGVRVLSHQLSEINKQAVSILRVFFLETF